MRKLNTGQAIGCLEDPGMRRAGLECHVGKGDLEIVD